jgi:aspartate/methionine/tyrosine aminotransferase
MPILSPRIRATAAPPVPEAQAWAARYDRGGVGLIDLTQAVPGYPPHDDLLARLAQAAGGAAAAKYGPIDGDIALRAALAAEISAMYAADIGAGDVAITAGCNLAFAMAMTVIAGPGDAVMLPAPWYFNHHMALTMAGIDTVALPCTAADGFVPDIARAAAALDAPQAAGRVRAIVLISPNNPTGAIYPPAVIGGFAALCRARGIWLVLDETYRDFLPADHGPPHPCLADPHWRDVIVQLYSFSKSYCIPGHRVGAIVAGGAFRAELLKVLDTQQICAPRAAQAALAWGIDALRGWRSGNRGIMAQRAAAFRTAIAAAPAWTLDALGGYFAYLRVPEGAPDGRHCAEILAARHGLASMPGSFFGPGQERHLRLAFANVDTPAICLVPQRLRDCQAAGFRS